MTRVVTLLFCCGGIIKTNSRLFSFRETINAEVTRHFPYGGAFTADSLLCARDSGTSLIKRCFGLDLSYLQALFSPTRKWIPLTR